MDCPPELTELLKTIYGLSGSESAVLVKICQEDWRASELASELGKDRSTVQRYLSKLRTAGLIERTSVTDAGKRGRHYVYSVPSKEDMKEKIRKRLREWEDEKMEALADI